MEPRELLNNLLEMQGAMLSDPVRTYVLEHREFLQAAKNVENFPAESVYIAMSVLERARGDCPLCGGRTVARRGVYFEHEHRCVVCDWIGER